jgi:hypothetical protein
MFVAYYGVDEGSMDLSLARVILICLWALNGMHVATYTISYSMGYEMPWGMLGSAFGGMFLWGYLLGKLEEHLSENEDSSD